MCKSAFKLCVGVVASICSATASGTVTVDPPGAATVGTEAGGYTVEIKMTASGDVTVISDASDHIKWIRSKADSDIRLLSQAGSLAGAVDEISYISGNGKFRIGDFSCTGDIGAVNVHRINFQLLSAGGDLTGSITILNPGTTTDINEIHFDSGTIRADIKNPYGSIGVITCNAAAGTSAQSPITVSCRDTLYEFHVTNAATYVNIADAASIPSQRTMSVGAVTSGGDFIGDIKAKDISQIGSNLWDTTIDIGRDYIGTIDLSQGVKFDYLCHDPASYYDESYIPAIRIGRSLHADSVIQVPDYTPFVPNPQSCRHGGIENQIVVNATNDPDGHISGHVFIGSQELDIKRVASSLDGQYQATSPGLGYGAVGQVPFALHGAESKLWLLKSDDTTVRGPYSESGSTDPNTIFVIPYAGYDEYLGLQIEFFGPVTGPGGQNGTGVELTDTLIFESRPLSRPNQDCWDNVDIGFKLFPHSPRRIDFLGAHAYNTQQPGAPTHWTPGQSGSPFTLGAGMAYRVRPNLSQPSGSEDHRLFCVVGNEFPLVRDDYFEFNVGCPCETDLNFDGVTNTYDLTILLLEFGRTQTCNTPPCPPPGSEVPCPPVLRADIVADNIVNTNDLTHLLVKFGTSCPAPPCGTIITEEEGAVNGAAMMGDQQNASSPTGALIAAMGFGSAEQYQTYVDSLTPQAQIEHIQFLIALARALGYE